jgi:hypothetical protein
MQLDHCKLPKKTRKNAWTIGAGVSCEFQITRISAFEVAILAYILLCMQHSKYLDFWFL